MDSSLPSTGLRGEFAVLRRSSKPSTASGFRRAGLHTGEVEVVGDAIAGIAVHIGARVAAAAGPGEVLVSSTVRDLVAGSGIEFEDRGLHELKGLDEPRRLFAVRQAVGGAHERL
jgi:class 3 adenylate cyclase